MFAGCGGDSVNYEEYAGRYIVTSVVEDEEEYIDYLPMMGIEAEEIFIELKANGNFIFDISAMAEDEDPIEGTFKIDGESLIMTVDGVSETTNIVDNRITYEDEGMLMVFERQ